MCFDKAIDSASLVGGGTASAITLYGYGGGGGGGAGSPATQKLALSSVGATATISPTNGSCATIRIPAVSGVGVDLDGFTVATVGGAAVKDVSGRASVQGAVGVTVPGTSTPEIRPELGETTGPKLVAVTKNGNVPMQLTYAFNRLLDPSVGGGSDYGYVQSNGTTVTGSTAMLGPAPYEVTVTFPGNVLNDSRYFVSPSASMTQTQDVPNPIDTLGGIVATRPTIAGVTPVTGALGAFDVTYSQPVTVADATKLVAYLEDNSTVPVTSGEITFPSGSSTMLRITFPPPVAPYASLITKIADDGGAVIAQSQPYATSVPGEGDITTPPMREGFTEGPDLINVALNPAAGTATYTFDGNYGSLDNLVANAGSFQLVDSDGTLSTQATSARVTGSNTVTAIFGAGQFANAVGGTISSGGVADYECGGACAAAQNLAPSTAAHTTTTTTTTTTPPTGRVHAVRVGLRASGRRISGGRTRVSFTGKIYLGHAFNPSFCYGKVNITLKHRNTKVATKTLGVGYRRCTFGQSITVRNGQLKNDGGRVYASFTGNKFVFPISSGAAVF
ncbi:MAG: hypothetical protein DLM64_15430 [Solirubrobacterales bacterium]|nr:MAG: hypothetical protein DLM64_15430 [Solirubrobacterales bacterium]